MLCIIATKGKGEGEEGSGRGKKKEEEKDFHGTNGVQLVSQLSFISSPLFFFFFYSAPDANSGLFAHCYSGQGISDVTR